MDGKNVRKMETFSTLGRLKVKTTHIMESHLAKCQRYARARIQQYKTVSWKKSNSPIMWGKINGEERLYDPGNVVRVVVTNKFQQERAITEVKSK